MNFSYRAKSETSDCATSVNFTKDSPCIWNLYPPGASGDLLASILNCHYGYTGSDYSGINERGQVIFRPSDQKITNIRRMQNRSLFDDQYFFEIAAVLADRSGDYSKYDQFIFSCHLHRDEDVMAILNTFANCKIIRTYFSDLHGQKIANFMSEFKNLGILIDPQLGENQIFDHKEISHSKIMNIPFGVLFSKSSYYEWYDKIIQFLDLNGRLICFDYVEYYISKQHHNIKNILIEYGRRL